MNQQTLQVTDAVPLALRVYEPEGAARASVVIGGAMGVRQSFYEAFALWMAQQGYRVTTFDYRGHGDSLQGALRDVKADLFDWAQDYEAVISERVHDLFGAALGRNRDECVPRVRRMGPCPCKQPGRPIARFRPNPSGKCLTGRSAALRRLPIARAIGCAPRLASHPGKVLARP